MSFGGTGNTNLVNNSKIKDVAMRLGKTPNQLLLKWALQQNIAVISKSRTRDHILSNLSLNFTLPEDDMKTQFI